MSQLDENHLDALEATITEYGFSTEPGGANHEVEGAETTHQNAAEALAKLRDPRTLDEIMCELREHPDFRAVVVWQAADEDGLEDPDAIEWGDVEDRMTERGWDAIYFFTESK